MRVWRKLFLMSYDNKMLKLAIEAFSVGALLAPTLLLAWNMTKPQSPQAILLLGFVIGVLFHLACELVGINKWYCQHGHACI